MNRKFIVDQNSKYNCGVQTYIYRDDAGQERAAYSGSLRSLRVDLTLSEYLAENPTYKVISEAELDALIEADEAARCEPVHKVDKERYWDMLEVLPPGSYCNDSFYVIERITGNLVSWFAEICGEYYETVDYASKSNADIRSKIMTSEAYTVA